MIKPIQQQRRTLIRVLLITAFAGGLPYSASQSAESVGPKSIIEIWKSPTCGCCSDWIKHLEANGFRTRAYDQGNTAKRREVGMPAHYGSCHTALIDGYVIEGHVPAREIKRLLRERPKALASRCQRCQSGLQAWTGRSTAANSTPTTSYSSGTTVQLRSIGHTRQKDRRSKRRINSRSLARAQGATIFQAKETKI